MDIRNSIWFELIDAKFGEIYLNKYISFNQTLIKSFNILTLILSISGIFSWKYFEEYVWLVFILIAVLQLITLIKNEIIRSNEEIQKIINLKNEYAKYQIKLEKLWFEINNNTITEKDASEKFYNLKSKYKIKIDKLDSQINIKNYKKLNKEAEEETNIHIKKFYYE